MTNETPADSKADKVKGISAFIKKQLYALKAEEAISFQGLVEALCKQFPHVKGSTSASARINLVLKQKKVARDFKKYTHETKTEDKTTKQVLIVWKTELEKQFDDQKAAALKEETPAAS